MSSPALPVPADPHEEKAISDVKEFGLHILNVFPDDDDEDSTNFSYSLGLWHTYRHPEVIVTGLDRDLSMWMLNEVARRIKEDGETFIPGRNYDGFLEGFDCKFVDVPEMHYRQYVGWCLWLYGNSDFPLRQCAWPSTDGSYPWDDAASEGFREMQPMLDRQR